MTPQLIETEDKGIEDELDRLTYSAYLLTLDSDLALSAVMAAVDASLEDLGAHPNLLRRTVELSLRQLRTKSVPRFDRESSPFEALLYGEAGVAESKRILWFKEMMSGNPIALLDYAARVTFVLHHVVGYKINEAAAMVEMSEKDYRVHLQNAYLQLASSNVSSARPASGVVREGRPA